MDFSHTSAITAFLNSWGYLGIFILILGESMGLTLPGETVLLAASIYAGRTHHLSIFWIITAAALGAIIGDNIGYVIGYYGGYRLISKFGKYINIKEPELKVGRYLFWKYGGRIVFFGRFIAILRILAALLAGLNHMRWKKFLLYNALGGIAWATIDGVGGYFFGRQFHHLSAQANIVIFIISSLIVTALTYYLHGHLKKLEKTAEKAYPGKLK